MDEEERVEMLCDAMAELLYGLWQEEQHQQLIAAEAAASVDEPASATEAKQAG
jgi:hypothetical protein